MNRDELAFVRWTYGPVRWTYGPRFVLLATGEVILPPSARPLWSMIPFRRVLWLISQTTFANDHKRENQTERHESLSHCQHRRVK